MSEHVKRARSPNYPAISLPAAMQQLRGLFDRIQKHKAPKEAVIKGLGYGGWNGASATALSAHVKYGLLERLEKDEYKISELGMRLMFHHSPQEYTEALIEASSKPQLFAELLEEYGDTVPHEDILKPRLIRQGFAQGAVETVIDSYRATMEFVSANSTRYSPKVVTASEAKMQAQTQPPRANIAAATRYETTFVRASEDEPFRVSFAGKGIEISGRITSQKDAEELVSAINALKLLLRPANDFSRPALDEEIDAGSDD